MAITPGTWSIAGINIPDFGWTEQNAPSLGVNPQQSLANAQQQSQTFGAGYTGPVGSQITPENVSAYKAVTTGTNLPQSSEINKNAAGYKAPMSTGTPSATQNNNPAPAQDTSTANKNPYNISGGTQNTDWYINEFGQKVPIQSLVPQGPSEEELNSIYNPAMEYLNQAESTLRGQLPTTMDLLGQQAQTSQGLLKNQLTSAQNQLGEQGTQTTQRKEDAISAARRLFSELQMANQQRFGGATSAGQAASELQGRELMQNRAAIGRDFGTAMRQIETSKADVENQYNSGLQQIEDRKQQAVNEVNSDFQSKLLEINSQRASTQQAKAAARLEALQTARDRVFQINLQDYNFKQQLAAQKAAADTQISQYSSSLQNQVGQGSTAAKQFLGTTPSTATTNMMVGGGSQTMQSPVYRGQISSKEDPYAQYTGAISPTTKKASDLLSSGQFNTQNLLGL